MERFIRFTSFGFLKVMHRDRKATLRKKKQPGQIAQASEKSKAIQGNKKSETWEMQAKCRHPQRFAPIIFSTGLRSSGINHSTDSVIPTGIEPERSPNRSIRKYKFARDEDGSDE
jgi:hypothetical protein